MIFNLFILTVGLANTNLTNCASSEVKSPLEYVDQIEQAASAQTPSTSLEFKGAMINELAKYKNLAIELANKFKDVSKGSPEYADYEKQTNQLIEDYNKKAKELAEKFGNFTHVEKDNPITIHMNKNFDDSEYEISVAILRAPPMREMNLPYSTQYLPIRMEKKSEDNSGIEYNIIHTQTDDKGVTRDYEWPLQNKLFVFLTPKNSAKTETTAYVLPIIPTLRGKNLEQVAEDINRKGLMVQDENLYWEILTNATQAYPLDKK
ncbi:MAG: hypothetical protein J0L93_05490 [Deltaproteobacteria bacterium]|nr:hypothetical protein [Deltaproteobacteria bacterium]